MGKFSARHSPLPPLPPLPPSAKKMLPSLESILHDRIQLALDALDYPPLDIPIKGDTNAMEVRYRSAIAFKLSSKLHANPIEIARTLALLLQEMMEENSRWENLQFQVTVSPPGWLDFRIADEGLADWLQQLLTDNLPEFRISTVRAGKSPFFLQYTHARCCELLRLAEREGLLSLDALQITTPDPIPWLDEGDRILRLQHPAERQLIAQWVVIVDICDRSKSPEIFGLAERLSQRFETFDRQCRIFGAVARETPHLAIGRSGLVSGTQKILNSLLTRGLGLVSPCSL